MTAPVDTTELRRLLAKATPGEWRQHQYQVFIQDGDCETEIAVVPDTVNCTLIVAAVNALPALLDAAEERDRLKAERDQLRHERDCWKAGTKIAIEGKS